MNDDAATEPCPRCGGTGHVHLNDLTSDEPRTRAPSPYSLVYRCPSCMPYGPFGLVPKYELINQSLCEVLPTVRARPLQKARTWVRWFLED